MVMSYHTLRHLSLIHCQDALDAFVPCGNNTQDRQNLVDIVKDYQDYLPMSQWMIAEIKCNLDVNGLIVMLKRHIGNLVQLAA